MRFALEPKTLDFVDVAPMRVADSAVVKVSASKLFEIFADIGSWTQWFPLMYRAAWVSERTSGVGAEREVYLRALGGYRERFVAWEPGKRFSFTMTASTSPIASSLLEDFVFTDVDGGARVDWVLVAEPRLLGKIGRPVLTAVMKRIFGMCGERLEKYAASH